MALLPDTYVCESHNGIVTCSARTESARTAFHALAVRIRLANEQLRRAGATQPLVDPPSSGTVGAQLVLATQNVLGVLSLVAPAPEAFAALFNPSATPLQMIAVVGEHADEIMAYIDRVCMNQPDVFTRAAAVAVAPPPPLGVPVAEAAQRFFTLDRVIGLAAGIASIGSLIYAAHATSRRLNGRADRSRLLPLAPGEEDAYDDDDGDDDGGDDDGGGDDGGGEPPPPGVIDAVSVSRGVEPTAGLAGPKPEQGLRSDGSPCASAIQAALIDSDFASVGFENAAQTCAHDPDPKSVERARACTLAVQGFTIAEDGLTTKAREAYNALLAAADLLHDSGLPAEAKAVRIDADTVQRLTHAQQKASKGTDLVEKLEGAISKMKDSIATVRRSIPSPSRIESAKQRLAKAKMKGRDVAWAQQEYDRMLQEKTSGEARLVTLRAKLAALGPRLIEAEQEKRVLWHDVEVITEGNRKRKHRVLFDRDPEDAYDPEIAETEVDADFLNEEPFEADEDDEDEDEDDEELEGLRRAC